MDFKPAVGVVTALLTRLRLKQRNERWALQLINKPACVSRECASYDEIGCLTLLWAGYAPDWALWLKSTQYVIEVDSPQLLPTLVLPAIVDTQLRPKS